MSKQYVEVAPAVPLKAGSRQTYTYHLPARLTGPSPHELKHQIVRIQFGRRNIIGVIMAVNDRTPAYRTRPVSELFPYRLTETQVAFAYWLAATLQGGLGFTLRLFLPPPGASTPLPPAAVSGPITGKLARQLQAIYATGGQALVIVPEKWMIDHLKETLGKSLPLTPYWAALPGPRRRSTWHAVAQGKPLIIIGTQKALFLPYQRLKLLVMMEEQYPAHKLWDQYPRLSNRYGVEQLSSLHGARELYVSSQPSLWLQHARYNKKIHVIVGRQPVPKLQIIKSSIVDRQQHMVVPHEFVEIMRDWLQKKQRVAIVYNRVGARGARIATIMRQVIPYAATMWRLDASTVAQFSPADLQHSLHSHQLVLATAALLATAAESRFDQVVWLFPETSLQYPDFRSAERSYSLLMRLCTLAAPRHPITLVTRRPNLLAETLQLSWREFYKRELAQRQQLHYPPFTDMIRLTITRRKADDAMSAAKDVRHAILSRSAVAPTSIWLRGPFLGFTPKRPGKHEAHLLLLGALPGMTPFYTGLPIDRVDLDPAAIL